MGSFYVNACVKDFSAEQVLAWLRQTNQNGFVGPTVNGWTSFVTEALEEQDPRAIKACGQAVTRDSDRVALIFLCHDEDLLLVSLYQGGEEIGGFDSAPGYFEGLGEFDPEAMSPEEEPAEADVAPLLREPQAFATALGVDEATVMDLLPQGFHEGPLELHERWVETLGLPEYSIAMGFRYVERCESDVEWAKA